MTLFYDSYHPLPIVFDRAFGAHVWDPEVSLIRCFLNLLAFKRFFFFFVQY